MKNRSVIVVDVSSITNLFPPNRYIGGVEADLFTLFALYCLAKGNWTVPQITARIIFCREKQENNIGRKNDGGRRIRELERESYVLKVRTGTPNVLITAIKPFKKAIEDEVDKHVANKKVMTETVSIDEIRDVPDVYCKIWKKFYYRFPQAASAYINAAALWKLPWIQEYENWIQDCEKKKQEVFKTSSKRV